MRSGVFVDEGFKVDDGDDVSSVFFSNVRNQILELQEGAVDGLDLVVVGGVVGGELEDQFGFCCVDVCGLGWVVSMGGVYTVVETCCCVCICWGRLLDLVDVWEEECMRGLMDSDCYVLEGVVLF